MHGELQDGQLRMQVYLLKENCGKLAGICLESISVRQEPQETKQQSIDCRVSWWYPAQLPECKCFPGWQGRKALRLQIVHITVSSSCGRAIDERWPGFLCDKLYCIQPSNKAINFRVMLWTPLDHAKKAVRYRSSQSGYKAETQFAVVRRIFANTSFRIYPWNHCRGFANSGDTSLLLLPYLWLHISDLLPSLCLDNLVAWKRVEWCWMPAAADHNGQVWCFVAKCIIRCIGLWYFDIFWYILDDLLCTSFFWSEPHVPAHSKYMHFLQPNTLLHKQIANSSAWSHMVPLCLIQYSVFLMFSVLSPWQTHLSSSTNQLRLDWDGRSRGGFPYYLLCGDELRRCTDAHAHDKS